MINEAEGGDGKRAADGEPQRVIHAGAWTGMDGDSTEQNPKVTDQATHIGNDHHEGGRYIFPKLNTPEWITALATVAAAVAAFGSVAIGIATCSIASDTGDLKQAVTHLSNLADQTKRQADELHAQFAQIKIEASAASSQAQTATQTLAQMGQQTSALQNTAKVAQGQLKEIQSEQRAWVASTAITPIGTPQIGAPVIVTMTYANVGKTPAFDFNVSQISQAVPIMTKWQEILSHLDCKKIQPMNGGPIVFPNDAAIHQTAIPPRKEFVYTPDVAAGKVGIVWQGCMAYRTLQLTHRTRWCVSLRTDLSIPLNQWHWEPCMVGNSAD